MLFLLMALFIAYAILSIIGVIFIIRGVIILIVSHVKKEAVQDSLNKEKVSYEDEKIKPARKSLAVKNILNGAVLCIPILSMVSDNIITAVAKVAKIPDKVGYIVIDDRGLFYGHRFATAITILFVIIVTIITRKIKRPLTWRGKILLGAIYLFLVASMIFAILMWIKWYHLWYLTS